MSRPSPTPLTDLLAELEEAPRPTAEFLEGRVYSLDLRAGLAAELCAEALLAGSDEYARLHADRYASRVALREEYSQQLRDLTRLAAAS